MLAKGPCDPPKACLAWGSVFPGTGGQLVTEQRTPASAVDEKPLANINCPCRTPLVKHPATPDPRFPPVPQNECPPAREPKQLFDVDRGIEGVRNAHQIIKNAAVVLAFFF